MSNPVSRNPVLLIHGIDDTVALFTPMTAYLQKQGWSVHSLDLIPNNGNEGLDVLAQQVANYVDRTFAPDQPLDLVGFSMGGIVSRYYVQRLGGIDRVQRFVTISSPHNGTWTGYLRFNPGCKQMCRNSLFLQDLNRDAAMLNQINFTSLWTPMDLMIVPANSSRLPVGREVVLPVAGHAWMVSDPRALQEVANALSEPIRSDRQFGYIPLPQK
ncbi:MAG TPA: triacylglycerol lipase [Crinalium sp.]